MSAQPVDVLAYRVMLRGQPYGQVRYKESGGDWGWFFIPQVFGKSRSRKPHATPQDAIKGRAPRAAVLEPIA